MKPSGSALRVLRLLAAATFLAAVGCGQRGGADATSSPSAQASVATSTPGTESPGTPSPVCGAYGCIPLPGQSGGGPSPTPPPGQTRGGTTMGTQSATGEHAVAYAYGTADHPGRIIARIEATPNQRVSGGWSIICSKGSEEQSGSNNFVGETPLDVRVPFPLASPDTCTASALAAIDQSGTLTVSLLAS